MGTECSFSGGKAAGTWSWPLTSIYRGGQECVELFLHSPNMPSWRGAQLKKSTVITLPLPLLLVNEWAWANAKFTWHTIFLLPFNPAIYMRQTHKLSI
jgi:hypothetical protein